MDETDNVIDTVLINRHSRELLMNDKLPKIFNRFVERNGDDIRPRRHHFANAFVAKRHYRLDEPAVCLR